VIVTQNLMALWRVKGSRDSTWTSKKQTRRQEGEIKASGACTVSKESCSVMCNPGERITDQNWGKDEKKYNQN